MVYLRGEGLDLRRSNAATPDSHTMGSDGQTAHHEPMKKSSQKVSYRKEGHLCTPEI